MEDATADEEHGVRFDLPDDIDNPEPIMRSQSGKHLTIVIKLGTSSIVDENTHQPILSILGLIVETVTKLRQDGHRVVLVSSGAIGVGLQRMNMEKKPKTLGKKQALAAVGQCRLMSMWDSLFTHMGQPVAQILLTRNDIADRTRYQNAQNTFAALMNMGVVPIVNENDTLSVQEIKFGDNDTLSAITAAMVQADYLFLMTDVDCLYTSNPRSNPDARPIEIVSDISKLEADVSSAGSALGTGGMSTKIVAARLATSAGVTTVITKSSKPGNVREIVDHVQAMRKLSNELPPTPNPDGTSSVTVVPQAPLHTRFLPADVPIRDRSFWLMYGLAPHGTIYIDEGAYRAVSAKAGLLPIGVVAVDGTFSQQEAVRIVVVKRTRPPLRWSRAGSPNSSSGSSRSNSPPPVYTPGTPSNKMDQSYSSLSSFEGNVDLFADVSIDAVKNEDLFEHLSSPPLEVGRALVNYSSAEIRRIAGLRSSEIRHMLGYADSDYVALRVNISLTHKAETIGSTTEERSSQSSQGQSSQGQTTQSQATQSQTTQSQATQSQATQESPKSPAPKRTHVKLDSLSSFA